MSENNNLNSTLRLHKGINQDSSLVDAPKETLRFALNTIKETEDGDLFFLTNENSNKACYKLTDNFIPIGKEYINDNEVIIFSTYNGISEIGILKENCEYEVFVNDENSTNKLNFSVNHQIDATYRLRRGCERTIYFTDNYNNVRYFNFDKPELFKTDNLWDADKFNLNRNIKSVPAIQKVSIVQQGSLKAGSYSVFLQYLDSDLNGTEFIELINNINIYNDSLNSEYSSIEGSISLEEEAYKYPLSSKAIKLELKNIDSKFHYYRLAFVHYTSGTGEVSKVVYSDNIETKNSLFIYTGTNGIEKGTVEDLIFTNKFSRIKSAKNIEQVDNRLLLSNITEEHYDFCKLQKYASKIQVDCYVKDILLTNVEEPHNSKNPFIHYNGTGYMPGEIYSLGVVYIFENNIESPVFHIPGKSSLVENNHVFSKGNNIYPMSNVNNQNLSEYYHDNDICDDFEYWGKDNLGSFLLGKNVRHHRFPTRDEIGLGFVEEISSSESSKNFKVLTVRLSGEIKKSVICEENDENCESYKAPIFDIIVRYEVNEIHKEFSETFYPDSDNIPISFKSQPYNKDEEISNVKIYYKEEGKEEVEISFDEEQPHGISYSYDTSTFEIKTGSKNFKVPILGLKLSNIEIPDENTFGKKIIGYKIVRQERKDADKTILDTAVGFPLIRHKKYVSSSLLHPEWDKCEVQDYENYNNDCFRVSKNNLTLLTPEHKFSDKTFDEFTDLKQIGAYKVTSIDGTGFNEQDVLEGTSMEDAKTERRPSRDNDGFSLKNMIRNFNVSYNKNFKKNHIVNEDIFCYNLNGLSWVDTEYEGQSIYNLSSDNKHLILSDKQGKTISHYSPDNTDIPYYAIVKNHHSFYQNFRNSEYYTIDNKIYPKNTCFIFGGDSYVCPLRYSNHVFLNVATAFRRKKLDPLKIVGAIFAVVIGVLVATMTGGVGAVATLKIVSGILTAVSGAFLGAAAVVEQQAFAEIYLDKWKLGLNNTVTDKFIRRFFISRDGFEQWFYRDDTLRWSGEIFSDFWFETSINISLRVKPLNYPFNYLSPLKKKMDNREDKLRDLGHIMENSPKRFGDSNIKVEGTEENYFYKKLTTPDFSKNGKLTYTGVSIPVIYLLNKDHNINKNIKRYYPLPLEYDCCSKCGESFPHRWMWSEQSFQEELTDNYRTFLSNNYKDISGETGEITNMFTIGNNLYLHTEEALYNIPRNYQERVTDQMITYIGTGEYGGIPEQKVSSTGCTHKWSTLKTNYGVFFVSERDKKIYQFDGSKVNPISSKGLSHWFRKNIPVRRDKNFKHLNKFSYPYKDNTSFKFGTGFISVYDPKHERIIFTKKDFSLGIKNKDISEEDLLLVGNKAYYFNNKEKTILEKEKQGWKYLGIENNKLKFYKIVTENTIYDYVNAEEIEVQIKNSSWTISYYLKDETWVSWHSYLPDFYVSNKNTFYSWKEDKKFIWEHNVDYGYNSFYGEVKPFIFEFVVLNSPVVNTTLENMLFQFNSKKYDLETNTFVEDLTSHFDNIVLYNSRQTTGIINVNLKNEQDENFFFNQVHNDINMSTIDKNERNWTMNNFRDLRIDYTKPIWSNVFENQEDIGFIDKTLNESSLDYNKSWEQLEMLRDKYLVVRIIFNNFVNNKYIINYISANENISFR